MSVLLPLLAAAPAVTGLAGYYARDIRGPQTLPTAPPTARPLVEYFDLADLTSTDTRGFVRPVERYEVQPWGLYVSRVTPDPRQRYVESWLLPAQGVRATVAHERPGHHRARDLVLDIGDYEQVGPKRWRATDHYLDVAVRHGHSSRLRGSSELLAAHAAGAVDTARADRAFALATAVLEGLSAHGHDVDRWLGAHGIALTWM
ncbi:DUF402 domain-containing protein [Nocardia thailandica]